MTLLWCAGQCHTTHAHVLVPLRGGPYAELALRISLAIAKNSQAKVTSFHIRTKPPSLAKRHHFRHARWDAPFRGLARVLANLPEIDQREIETDKPADAIVATSRDFELVVMGASAQALVVVSH